MVNMSGHPSAPPAPPSEQCPSSGPQFVLSAACDSKSCDAESVALIVSIQDAVGRQTNARFCESCVADGVVLNVDSYVLDVLRGVEQPEAEEAQEPEAEEAQEPEAEEAQA